MNRQTAIWTWIAATLFLLNRVVIAQGAAPSNDDFANAQEFTVGKTTISVNLTTSTLEAGEQPKSNQIGSVWYKWTAPTNGIARVSVSALAWIPKPGAFSTAAALSDESIFYEGGGIITTVGDVSTTIIGGQVVEIGPHWWAEMIAYRGSSLLNLTPIQVGPNFDFSVAPGETILICFEVYKSAAGQYGELYSTSSLPDSFYFDFTPPPANDSYSSTLAISESAGGDMAGHLLGATREPDEPDLGSDYSGTSVWFHYTAATFGSVTFTPSANIPFAIFSGSDLSNLQLVAKTNNGAISIFGEEGKSYHIAVYESPASTLGFGINFTGPKYRLYETNVDGLMPGNERPHFYGVRGVTMLYYAKTETGWRPIEIEPIVNRSANLVIRPADALDGQVRVVTIDEPLPAPHVRFRSARGNWVSDLIGYAGQTCAVSFSTDLVSWSQPQVHTLDAPTMVLDAIDATNADGIFYRVTQSYPAPPDTVTQTIGGITAGVTVSGQPTSFEEISSHP